MNTYRRPALRLVVGVLALLLAGPLVVATAQMDGSGSLAPSPQLRVQRAMSDSRYPATPGDVYRLTFTQATEQETLLLYVSPDYTVSMDFLGSVDATGLTFHEVRSRVQEIVQRSYPGASMRLAVEQTGEFPVFVRGEVKQSGEIYAWGLNRLSSLPESAFTSGASFRNVQVIDADGTKRTYDLLQAQRYGERDQNPLLRPGQTIVIPRYDRRISIKGTVHRPGTYDLLPDETYADLLEFAGGYQETADQAHIRLARYVELSEGGGDSEGRPQEAVYLSHDELADTELRHLDAVRVADRLQARAVFFVEGAVRPPDGGGEADSATAAEPVIGAQRVPTDIIPGQRLSEYVYELGELFTQNAALEDAYIKRGNEIHAVDLLALAQGQLSLTADPVLRAGDVLVVPFRQLQVTVLGAVNQPGRYPYVPDRSWRYYVNLAGGFSDDLNNFGTVRIRDGNEQSVSLDEPVGPEYTIVARRDSPRYWFVRSIDLATTSMNFTTALIELLDALGVDGTN
ncbi:MAG: SLBB domain-containing protein [bacterium]